MTYSFQGLLQLKNSYILTKNKYRIYDKFTTHLNRAGVGLSGQTCDLAQSLEGHTACLSYPCQGSRCKRPTVLQGERPDSHLSIREEVCNQGFPETARARDLKRLLTAEVVLTLPEAEALTQLLMWPWPNQKTIFVSTS